MKKGFTLIELLAVIVILAIISLIATPVVLDIINNAKENTKLRSAEKYLDAVEQAILRKNVETIGGSIPSECQIITNGNVDCNGKIFTVEVDGEIPDSGIIKYENGKIININLVYDTDIIVMNESGVLEYQ